MKLKYLTISILLLSATACLKEEDFVSEPLEGLIDLTIQAGTQHSSQKVSTGWDENENLAYWSEKDSIGIFAGSGNVNRRFVLSSKPDMTSGTFFGQMTPVSTPTALFAYYPYAPGAVLNEIPFPSIQKQEFEGTFEEKGDFNSFGRYALMLGSLKNFTVQTKWPEESKINFEHITGVVRFAVSNSLDKTINIKSIKLHSENNSFVIPKSVCIQDDGSYTVDTSMVASIISSISEKNIMEVQDGEKTYSQMVVFPNSFKSEDSLKVVVNAIDDDGVDVRYTLKKKVSKNNSFQEGKRTTINVPLTTEIESRAKRVKVTTLSATFTSPTFRHGKNYSAGDAVWEYSDKSWGEIEKYAPEISHTFSAPGEHTSSFNHWGKSPMLSFKNLKGVKAIDFTDVY